MNSKLILGTVQLGLNYGINNTKGKPSEQEAFAILETAYDNGIKTLDTAEAYGNSMQVIGNFHKKHPTKIFNVITKLDAQVLLTKGDLYRKVNESCKTLYVDKIHGYMFHNFESFKKNLIYFEELLEAKKKGLVKKIGVSLFFNHELNTILEEYSDIDFIQLPFNLFDNELKRKKHIEKAKEMNIEIHTRSVFFQGLFFKEIDSIPLSIKPLKEALRNLEEIKNEFNMDIGSLALNYALEKKYIDFVLIGVESRKQLISNLELLDQSWVIPHKRIDEICIENEDLLNPSNW
ncbi:aldo/keto reductase [Flavobacteriaceae bacterium]|nr:aldo/keto reductase [Flavobacteriaceae bacterium]